MYLDSIALVRTTPCLAEPGKIIVTGKPSHSLERVIPYLASLPNVISFNPVTCTLTLRRKPGFITFYPDKVHITKVTDAEEGMQLLDALKGAINATWERRHELVAATKKTKAPRPLDVYALLPQTNCKECGEATCMAFAFGLLTQDHTLEECSGLNSGAKFADRRATLEAML